jgi:hypothetical protein
MLKTDRVKSSTTSPPTTIWIGQVEYIHRAV